MRLKRAALVWLVAGGLAMLLVAQLGAAAESGIKRHKSTSDESTSQRQDKNKNVWEEEQERRLLVRRSAPYALPRASFRADPMLADTRRGGLGSSARSIGDPSTRSALFGKRRRLHSSRARSMARARSAARRFHKRFVGPDSNWRRFRSSSSARSMSARRARKLRNSRRFTGWQPAGRFARDLGRSRARAGAEVVAPLLSSTGQLKPTCPCSASEPREEDSAKLTPKGNGLKTGAQFADGLAQKSEQLSVGLGPFELLKIRKTVELSHRERVGSLLEQSIRHELEREQKQAAQHLSKAQKLNELLQLTISPDAKLQTPNKNNNDNKTLGQHLGQSLAYLTTRPKLQDPNGAASRLASQFPVRQTISKVGDALGSLKDGKQPWAQEARVDALVEAPGGSPIKSIGKQASVKLEARLPHDHVLEDEGDNGAGVSNDGDDDHHHHHHHHHQPRGQSGAQVGAQANAQHDGQSARGTVNTLIKELTPVIANLNETTSKLPLVGDLSKGLTDRVNLTHVVQAAAADLNDTLPSARSGSPADKVAIQLPDGASQTPVVGQALDSLKSLTDSPSQGPSVGSALGAVGQTAEGALDQAGSRKGELQPRGDKEASQASAQLPLRKLPGATASLVGLNAVAAKDPQEAKLSGSLTRPSSSGSVRDPEAKLDEEIKSAKPNLAALSGSQRGPDPLSAIGDTIKHKLAVAESSVKQEVSPALSSVEALVKPESERQDDDDDHRKDDPKLEATKIQPLAKVAQKLDQDDDSATNEPPRRQVLQQTSSELEPDDQRQESGTKSEPQWQQHQVQELPRVSAQVAANSTAASPDDPDEDGDEAGAPIAEKSAKSVELRTEVKPVAGADDDADEDNHDERQDGNPRTVVPTTEAPDAEDEPKEEEGANLRQQQERKEDDGRDDDDDEDKGEPKKPEAKIKLKLPVAPKPGLRPLAPLKLSQMPFQRPLKSTKGYQHLLRPGPGALYESPRVERLPAKCASSLAELTSVLNQILALVEKLGQRVLVDSSIDYLTRDSLSRKLSMIRAFAEEARMQASLGRLRRLNDSGRAAGVELMRLANWPAGYKLHKSLRPLALETRKLYINYRKACKGVASN